jgi:hypothetical protein
MVDRPEHTGLFEAGADDGFASGFDHAGADEQVLAAKLGMRMRSALFSK